jgi:hypothetical protein
MMASQLALQVAERHFETTKTIGAQRLADNVDAELQEVRHVLDGLMVRQWSNNTPIMCWCDAVGDGEHNEPCQRARQLAERLRVR